MKSTVPVNKFPDFVAAMVIKLKTLFPMMDKLDGALVRIYDPEKTIVDCFRYRNKIGMDVVLEALRLWRQRRRRKLDILLKYARMRHVERAMCPYLEAMP